MLQAQQANSASNNEDLDILAILHSVKDEKFNCYH